MQQIQKIIFKIKNDDLLTEHECSFLAEKIINKSIDDLQISSLLSFLYIKGESYSEIYSFVKVLRKKMNRIIQNLQNEGPLMKDSQRNLKVAGSSKGQVCG